MTSFWGCPWNGIPPIMELWMDGLSNCSHRICIVFLLLEHFILVVTGTYTETTWQSSIRVNEYKSYGSVRMVEYKIPDHTYTSHWYFTGSYSPEDKCDERTILIYLQHGSYPLITPLNETFPDNFYLERTHLHMVLLNTNYSTLLHAIDNPLPGSWFAGILLGNYVDEKISVKDMGTDCKYYLAQATHIVGVLDNVDSILTDTEVNIELTQDSSSIYRFHTMEHTWQYTLTLDECVVDVVSTNNSDLVTEYADASCPVRIATRASALPDWDPQHSDIVNCSTQSEAFCVSTITQPATNAWNYILLESLIPGTVNFTLSVSTQECTRDEPYKGRNTKHTHRDDESTHQQVQLANFTLNSTDVPYVTNMDGGRSSSVPTIVLVDSMVDSPSAMHSSPPANSTSPASGPEIFTATRDDDQPIQSCSRLPELGRYESPTSAFQAKFYLRVMEIALINRLPVSDLVPTVMKFDLRQNKDIGGTLHFDVMLENYLLNFSQIVVVRSCIQKDSIPVNEDGSYCEQENMLEVNSTVPLDMVSATLYFPYPEAGAWYISLQAACYNNVTLDKEPCRGDWIFMQFLVDLTPCVDGGCGENGNCREYFSGVLHYSVCQCIGKWRGYACTDDSVAMSDSEQLLAALLLTLSNLFFMPAILLSLYRRFWTEALVYFYTMFFSTFYHACDGDRKYIYCMMPYDVLAICDFFGAILSFWVTIITMAKLLETMRTFLFMLGALALVMGVTWDRFSLWTFLVPIATALGIMGVAWTQRCYKRRHCYPSMKRWLFYLIPGILVAGAGLIVYAFFETESNYHYTHSTWHACIALCIVFLLPPKQPKVKEEFDVADLSDDDIDLVQTVCISDSPKPADGDTVCNGGTDNAAYEWTESSDGNTIIYPL